MRRPLDWPEDGPIDLSLHDCPHASAATEWWYINSHVAGPDGREFSVFAAFFRIARSHDEETGVTDWGYSLTWAISDVERSRYFAESWVDRAAPEIGIDRLERGYGSKDARINRALREVLDRGNVPLPDQLFEADPSCPTDRLDLDYGGATLRSTESGTYVLHLASEHHGVSCDLEFVPKKAPVRHGDNGVVTGRPGEEMFYYFIPRCEARGTIRVDDAEHDPAAAETPPSYTTVEVSGSGWYDHEFGGPTESTESGDAPAQPSAAGGEGMAWNWVAAQLEDGTEFSAATMVDMENGEVHDQVLIVIDADGKYTRYTDVDLTPGRQWRSKRTFFPYPVSWHLACPSADVDVNIDAVFDDQEIMTVLSMPAFWEGRCAIEGTMGGREIKGVGFVERSGFEPLKTLDDFFGAVGIEVRKSVAFHVPRDPTWEQTRNMIASEARSHYMDGVDPNSLARAMADPIRLITDRGGKSWRSYAALACCDVVGGDSRRWMRWLALPELMHVGSLIVDDVQDESEWRRGGPSCHEVYGSGPAINSGTACYFMGHGLLFGDDVTDAVKLRLYDLYFEALRAGHAGQGIDLSDRSSLLRSAAESGDSDALERSVIACHRLKTAAPAAALARMGALVGGGTEEQIEGVGRFFEALGVAFQIIDDVLNIRGFSGGLKTQAEDVRAGTITVPIAKAMSRLEADQRLWVAETLLTKPTDDEVVAKVVDAMESCGAVDACVQQASDLVERAWERVEPLLRDSFPKIMLRAFGWYVLERHY